jgi:enoyl-CoA hydratase
VSIGGGPANVRVDQSDAIAVVTLDRPPVNALDRPTLAELKDVFDGFAAQRDVNVVVLTGAGERAFCAGVDLHDSVRRYDRGERAATAPADQLDPGRMMREMFWSIYDCAVPVVAAVNGPAIGAGLGMACMADVIIASEKARFGLTEIDVGVLGGAAFAVRLAGPYKARRMFYSGELLSAADLHRHGSIEAVVPPDRMLDEALALARQFASKSPIGLRLAKASFNRVEHLALKDAYQLEQDYTEKLRTYDDSAEAGAARREKRQPEWGWR